MLIISILNHPTFLWFIITDLFGGFQFLVSYNFQVSLKIAMFYVAKVTQNAVNELAFKCEVKGLIPQLFGSNACKSFEKFKISSPDKSYFRS